jgi:hypothetical protein
LTEACGVEEGQVVVGGGDGEFGVGVAVVVDEGLVIAVLDVALDQGVVVDGPAGPLPGLERSISLRLWTMPLPRTRDAFVAQRGQAAAKSRW